MQAWPTAASSGIAMTSFEQNAIEQMRQIHEALSERHAGLAVLHLDAAIAALESHVRRQAKVQDQLSLQVTLQPRE